MSENENKEIKTMDDFIDKKIEENLNGFCLKITEQIDCLISKRIMEHMVSILYYFILKSDIDVDKPLSEIMREFISSE